MKSPQVQRRITISSIAAAAVIAGTVGAPAMAMESATDVNPSSSLVSEGVSSVAGTRDSSFNGVLLEGKQLTPGEVIVTSNWQRKVEFKDGRLVGSFLQWYVFWIEDWSIDVGDADRVVMQGDGNLVAYKGNTATWSSGTPGKPSSQRATAVVTDAGVLQVKHGNTVVWASDGSVTPAPQPDPDADGDNVLKAGKVMKPGDQLVSKKNDWKFVFQTDGNLVIYNKAGKATWNSRTAGKKDAKKLVVQADGNVVLYNSKDKPLWTTATSKGDEVKNPRLKLTNDGQLQVLHAKDVVWTSKDSNGTIIDVPAEAKSELATNGILKKGEQLVSPDGKIRFVFQTDGNLVTYDSANKALWNSQTAGKSDAAKLVMQGDGNLVLYTADDKALWNTATTGGTGKKPKLTLNNNGVLRVFFNDKVVWTSKDSNGTIIDTPVAGKSELGTNGTMKKGDQLVSPDGKMRFVFQTDGNLVTYDSANKPVWNSMTAGKTTADKLIMQGDGNLVLYTADNKPLWNTATTGGNDKKPKLTLNNAGVLKIFFNDKVVWNSKDSAGTIIDQPAAAGNKLNMNGTMRQGDELKASDGSHRFVFQTDGNLVVYTKDNKPVWNSQTAGRTDATKLIMQGDGNLVLYTDSNEAVWNTVTGGRSPKNVYAQILNDGTFRVVADDAVIWKSN